MRLPGSPRLLVRSLALVPNPTRVIRIDKPSDGQAVTAEASYDGTVRIDFSAIANEKITLVHIGERLIILFDNKSTVTIIPFFDSMGVPLANITIEFERQGIHRRRV